MLGLMFSSTSMPPIDGYSLTKEEKGELLWKIQLRSLHFQEPNKRFFYLTETEASEYKDRTAAMSAFSW